MTQTAARQTLTAQLVRDLELTEAKAAETVSSLTDTEVTDFLAAQERAAAQRAELLSRVTGDAALRSVICPPVSWKTANDRYDVTRRALKLVERAAAQGATTVDAIVAELVRQGDSITREIEMYPEDPRTTKWGRDFYGFRHRLTSAIEGTKREEKRAARAAKIAAAEARGEEECSHCGGVGGADHWPGFTCYECGGKGFVRKGRR